MRIGAKVRHVHQYAGIDLLPPPDDDLNLPGVKNDSTETERGISYIGDDDDFFLVDQLQQEPNNKGPLYCYHHFYRIDHVFPLSEEDRNALDKNVDEKKRNTFLDERMTATLRSALTAEFESKKMKQNRFALYQKYVRSGARRVA